MLHEIESKTVHKAEEGDQGCQVQRKKMRDSELSPKDSFSLVSPGGPAMVGSQLRCHENVQN